MDKAPADDTQINYCQDDSQVWTEDNILEHKAVQETIRVITTIAINEEDRKHPSDSTGDMSLNMLYEMQVILWKHWGIVDSEECYAQHNEPYSEHAIAVCSRLD